MKEISKEVFSLKNNDPRKWGELSNILVNEYRSESFKKALDDCLYSVVPNFRQRKANNDSFPYHQPEVIERDDFSFRYIIQVIALDDFSIEHPLPIICGVLPFPGEKCYTFNVLDVDPKINKFEIDVFSPHVIKQYALRSSKLKGEPDSPKRCWYSNIQSNGFNEKEFRNLSFFIKIFFESNKINKLIDKKDAYSGDEQKSKKNKDRKHWPVTLWPEGLTFSETFNADNENYCLVTLHKSFLSYIRNPACHSIEEDAIDINQTEAIASDFASLAQSASVSFPEQYKAFRTFIKRSERAINNALTVCQASKKMCENCMNFICDTSIFILTNKEKIEFDEEYKSPKLFSLEKIQKAKEIVAKNKNFATSNTENVKEVFYAFFCITNCLRVHVRRCSELNEKITTTDVPNSLLYRMQMMSVLTEMAELYQLLHDFFPEGQSSRDMKFS